MSPTVFRYKGYRFFFFSREEERRHVHIYCADGECKYWIEPEIELAKNYGLNTSQLSDIKGVVEDKIDEIVSTRQWVGQ